MLQTSQYLFDLPHEYLKPVLVMSLLSVWVLVGLFFYLNVYTRRRYFTIWSAAWLFYAIWLTLSLNLHESGPQPFLGMIRELCVGLAAVFMLWGASNFLKHPVPEKTFGLLLVFLALWNYVGAYQSQVVLWIQVPIFALLALGSGLTAFGFLQVRRRLGYIGAGLLSVGFCLWGGFLACYPLWGYSEGMVTPGFFISAVLTLFIAVSMIILVLEEVRTSNQKALQQIQQQQSEAEGLRTRIVSTEERYRSLFAQASEAIIITASDDLRILDLNEAAQRLLGVARSDGGGQSLSTFLRSANQAGHAGSTDVNWFTDLIAQPRVELVRTDGAVIPTEVSGAPVAFDGVPAYQLFFREVTERARLEHQLRQAEKLSALGQMISGVAHELNNPLAVIKGYLDLILARHDLNGRTRTDLEKVAHEGDRAAKLVSNFLSFARERPAQREKVDLNALIHRITELREIDLRISGIQLMLQLDEALPTTEADPAQLEQVLVNLVSNAIHALSESAGPRRIRISTSLCGDLIALRVDDNGPGIPAEVQPHIFEPFFTTKPEGSGTGLGLSIAHSILAEHSGRILYESSPEGGAGFVLELPVVATGLMATSETDAAAFSDWPPIVAQSGARILVLDDEQVLAELLAELLATLGHSPVTCCSAARALQLVEEEPFDLVISDFRMPLMNGREFFERLRESQPDLARRIIFLTGDVVNSETRTFLEAVGNPHLSKPFRLDVIGRVVGEMLQGQAILA